jgi:hypothetical protein
LTRHLRRSSGEERGVRSEERGARVKARTPISCHAKLTGARDSEGFETSLLALRTPNVNRCQRLSFASRAGVPHDRCKTLRFCARRRWQTLAGKVRAQSVGRPIARVYFRIRTFAQATALDRYPIRIVKERMCIIAVLTLAQCAAKNDWLVLELERMFKAEVQHCSTSLLQQEAKRGHCTT